MRVFLLLALIMGVLFAWRSWRAFPGAAALAAALATAAGVFLFQRPILIPVGAGIAAWLIYYASEKSKPKW